MLCILPDLSSIARLAEMDYGFVAVMLSISLGESQKIRHEHMVEGGRGVTGIGG